MSFIIIYFDIIVNQCKLLILQVIIMLTADLHYMNKQLFKHLLGKICTCYMNFGLCI